MFRCSVRSETGGSLIKSNATWRFNQYRAPGNTVSPREATGDTVPPREAPGSAVFNPQKNYRFFPRSHKSRHFTNPGERTAEEKYLRREWSVSKILEGCFSRLMDGQSLKIRLKKPFTYIFFFFPPRVSFGEREESVRGVRFTRSWETENQITWKRFVSFMI